jgi:hypothetical protein
MANMEPFIEIFAPLAAVMGIGGLGAWFYLERMKIKNGYPTENIWGKPMYPKGSDDKITALENDLARKSAQIARLDERVQTLERILTDRSSGLAAEIDRLRG